LVKISRTFKDFRDNLMDIQGPDMFSSTFQDWKMKEKIKDIQELSSSCGNREP